jgi:hypothetical protein
MPERTFSDFRNPFVSGWARRCSPHELVNYSFQALEAWGREYGVPRLPDQTPHEFAYQLGMRVNAVASAARILADLYCLAAYAPGALSAANLQQLPAIWQQLEQNVPRAEATVL